MITITQDDPTLCAARWKAYKIRGTVLAEQMHDPFKLITKHGKPVKYGKDAYLISSHGVLQAMEKEEFEKLYKKI